MKISNVELIKFKTRTRQWGTRWGYGVWGEEHDATAAVVKISTDEGAEGYTLLRTSQGVDDEGAIEHQMKPLLVGEDPLDREKLWHWMYQAFTHNTSRNEVLIGAMDCALWDLFGRMIELPVHKILGGCRDKITAYASTFPNLGGPEVYAEHALECKRKGYKAYKVHANICWDPHNKRPAPQLPGFPKEDVEICRAVREAVGDDMVLMLDPFGVYTLEESLWVGRELEKLNYYWLEHPMPEFPIEAYRRLTRELRIAICSPEHVRGGVFSRAEWVLQGASDMLRIDQNYGGITGSYKMVNICEAYGIQCEMHGGGWSNSQILAATPEATCKYFERGLLRPDADYETPPPYLKANCDPMDDDGNVILPQKPGLGMEIIWDYINDNRV